MSRMQILIADDQIDSLLILEDLLGQSYEVQTVNNGVEALASLERGLIPDLILLDVVMPQMDGFAVCRQLKSSPFYKDIPVIFLTSLESDADEEFGLSLGAEDFIHKPISPAVVRARVRNHLMLAQARRDLKWHNEELERIVEERTREVQRKARQVIASQDATISAFCALAETRDNDTGNHILRTQRYVRVLAEALQERFALSSEQIELFFKSAPLHDIGKVAIPDAILLKPGKLTPAEWEIMKTHSVAGKDAIEAAIAGIDPDYASFLHYAKEIAWCHHERWDGTGYPRGIAGPEIPISARLMAVADVYDALSSKRVYKAAMSHERAISMIVEGRGSHFDPEVVDALMTVTETFAEIAATYADHD